MDTATAMRQLCAIQNPPLSREGSVMPACSGRDPSLPVAGIAPKAALAGQPLLVQLLPSPPPITLAGPLPYAAFDERPFLLPHSLGLPASVLPPQPALQGFADRPGHIPSTSLGPTPLLAPPRSAASW